MRAGAGWRDDDGCTEVVRIAVVADGWTRVELPTTSGNVGQLTGIMHVHLVCVYICEESVVMTKAVVARQRWWVWARQAYTYLMGKNQRTWAFVLMVHENRICPRWHVTKFRIKIIIEKLTTHIVRSITYMVYYSF